jgi:hypothetical protein
MSDLPEIHPETNWRYAGMSQESWQRSRPYYEKHDIPLLEEHLKRDRVFPLPSPLTVSAVSADLGSMIAWLYCYGYPMDYVLGIYERGLRLLLRMLKEALEVRPTRQDDLEQIHWENFELMLLGATLIDATSILEQAIPAVKALCESPLLRFEFETASLQLVRTLIVEPKNKQKVGDRANALKAALESDEALARDFDTELVIATMDADRVNEQFRQEVLYRDETLGRRKYDEEHTPDEVFDLGLLLWMALALHVGIPITYSDTAIPIWDFPIASRPDVIPLLPPRPPEAG